MMKRLMTIGLIFLCHAALFVAIYFGRLNRVALCGSDVTLFTIPFVAAVAAYATVLAKIIKTRNLWMRWVLAMIAGIITGAASMTTGMTIAFNQWGT